MHNNRRQQVVNKTIGQFGALGMDDCCLCCCMLLLVIFSWTTGVPCLYHGNKCKNADLRAEHKNGLCKNIHSDESAIALQVFGWIFSIPWLIAFFVCLAKLKGTVSVDVECNSRVRFVATFKMFRACMGQFLCCYQIIICMYLRLYGTLYRIFNIETEVKLRKTGTF